MAPTLNFYPVKLEEERLVVWSNPEITGEEIQDLKEEYDSIYFRRKEKKNLAVPANQAGITKLNELGFIKTPIIAENNPRLFSYLISKGFARHLMDTGLKYNGKSIELHPLYYREEEIKTNNFSTLYKYKRPIFEFKELKQVEGVEARVYYFNLQSLGFVAGITLRTTTTRYFTAGLEKLLKPEEVEKMPDFYVQRRTPPECKESCQIYDESRLLGKFKGFAENGSGCVETDKYVELENSRVDRNVPASRVVFERNDKNIKAWGELRGEDDIIGKLSSLNTSDPSDYAMKRYQRLKKFANGIKNNFQLPNGQRAELKDSLKFRVIQ